MRETFMTFTRGADFAIVFETNEELSIIRDMMPDRFDITEIRFEGRQGEEAPACYITEQINGDEYITDLGENALYGDIVWAYEQAYPEYMAPFCENCG